MKHIIKHLLMAIVIALSATGIIAQNSQDNPELSHKDLEAIKNEQLHLLSEQMHVNRSFVLKSDYLQNLYGVRIPVTSNINFVMVDGDEAVIQIGSNTGLGYNGVGGITVKGINH